LDFVNVLPEKKKIFCDNYGSLELGLILQEKKVDFVFNVRKNRPTWLYDKGLLVNIKEKGEKRFLYSPDGGLVALSKFDKKKQIFYQIVLMLMKMNLYIKIQIKGKKNI